MMAKLLLCCVALAVLAAAATGFRISELDNEITGPFDQVSSESLEIPTISSEKEDVEVWFKCPAPEGLFRNPRNCSSFIQCSHGKPNVMPCPKGLDYSEETKRCEQPCEAYCNRTLSCKCDWKTCGLPRVCFLTKDSGPCHASKQRYFFNKRTGECEQFLYGGCKGNKNNFETKEACEKRCSKSGHSEDDEISMADEQVELMYKCLNDGLYPNPRNCSTFIQCSNGKPYVMPCPKGLHYSTETKRCERQCEAYCNRTLSCECKWPTCGLPSTCFWPKYSGPCQASKQRYFFNKRTGQCEQFLYGGCKGNPNNFETKEECEKRCSKSDPSICRLPKEVGPCKAAIPRYYYNKDSGKCEKFTYGGCKGNENNFRTQEECERRCSKSGEHSESEESFEISLSVEEDAEVWFKCPTESGLFRNPRNCSSFIQCSNGKPNVMPCPKGLHYSEETKRCEQPCEAYCNRTLSCKCDWKTCGLDRICFLPKVIGPCRASIPSWFFNKRTGVCEKFRYGGCLGNQNNFETKEACEKRCSKSGHSSDDEISSADEQVELRYKCLNDGLYRNPRNCSTFIQCSNGKPNVMPCPRGLHYSEETKRCEQRCEAYCNRTLSCECKWPTCGLPRDCFLSKDSGPCHASKERYFFNKRTGQCEKFLFGGCKGNSNNFETKEKCEKKCSKSSLMSEESSEISTSEEEDHDDAQFWFQCPHKSGLYRNPRNCSSFIQCSNGKPNVMPCPRGLHFSEETKRCEQPCEAYCNRTLSCKCEWKTCGLPRECFFSKDSGPCHASKQRYFFNRRTGECEQFLYGGCKGNKNNFETKEACEKRCSKSSHSDADEISEADEQFEAQYKCPVDGLYPNPRNCSTFIQCSNGKPYVMPCPKGLHYSTETKRCERQCEAYCNRTLSCECKWPTCGLPRECFLPKYTGPCKANMPRYYFNKRTGKCEKFVYGGCQGNKNNFETKEECEKRCSKSGSHDDDISVADEMLELTFKCFKDGLYSNPRNCSSFIQCSNGNPHVMPCPKGLHYSVKAKRCEEPCKAYCNKTLSCQCKWPTCGLPDLCFLPYRKGPCHAAIPRYYFNKRTGKCERFVYGGCRGNSNNFESKEACEKICRKLVDELATSKEHSHEDFSVSQEEEREMKPWFKCSKDGLFRNPRNCSTFIQCSNGNPHVMPCPKGLHYSEETKRCEQPCEAYCNRTLSCECKWPTCGLNRECFLPKEEGVCHASKPRWFFNRRTGVCEKFLYGGCGGNKNNFETKEACEKRCSKSGHSDEDEISVADEQFEVRYTCSENGLYPNPRNCSTFIQCSNGKPYVMPCPKGLHYSEKTKRCEQPCEAYCKSTLSCKCKWPTCGLPYTCFLPQDKGPCHASVDRYFFNKRTGQCEKFIYGGCKGNPNNFETKEACEKRCSKKTEDEEEGQSAFMNVCRLPKDQGPCSAKVNRFYFDYTMGRCRKFVYGGCGGNENRFRNLKECELKCLRRQYGETLSSEEQPEAFRCPSENGDFPHPQQPEKFIRCKDNRPQVYRCPPSMTFSEDHRACVNEEEFE